MRRHVSQLLQFWVLILALFVTYPALCAPEDAPSNPSPKSALVHFASTSGGFAIDIPPDWHAQEFPTKSLYRATVSATPVQKAEDKIELGLYIERTLDYKRAFGWEKGEPKVLAISQIINLGTLDPVSRGTSVVVSFTPQKPTPEQIAESIAASRAKTPDGGKGLPAVVLIPHDPSISLPGMDTFQYDAITDYGGKNCIYHQFLIGIAKKQWLSLHLISTGCQDQAASESNFTTILRTLAVDKKWEP